MSLFPWISCAAAAALAAYTNPIPQPGEPGYASPDRGKRHFRMMTENDNFVNRDNGYTHGTRIDYARDLNDTPWSYGLSLTQTIFTPYTKTLGNVPGERPYAGYLALGGAFMRRSENIGLAAELQLGTTGKASLAGDAQHAVHAMRGFGQWRGWGSQVRAEPTLQLTLRQDWRVPVLEQRIGKLFETDGTFFTREQLGTVTLGAAAGLTLRFGRNLPDSMQVNGIEAANYGIGLLEKPNYDPSAFSWFLYAQGQVRFVGRDITIDGGVFHDFERTCSRKPWIAEVQLGAAASYQGIDYYVGVVCSSHTYRGECSNPMHGTCGVTWHW